MNEQVACNLCGTTSSTVLHTVSDFLLDRKEAKATFVRCASCGLIYQNPRPTFAEMAAHYPPDYESYAPEPDAEDSSWLLRQAIRYGVAKRCRYVTRYKHAGRLLDVGCATGIFLQGIRNCGNWEPYGVEINEHVVRIAQGHGLDVRLGTLEQARFADEFFDVVTLWDVLEHLHDPAASLREIHRILKPDGLLLIRLPNATSRDASMFGPYWAGWDPPRHLYVFTPPTLAKLLQTAGFSVRAWSSSSGGNAMFNLSLRFWVGLTQADCKHRKSAIRVLQNPITQVLTAPIFYLRGLGLKGPLMIVSAMKMQAADYDLREPIA